MGRPQGGYRNKNGDKLPGTTTIISNCQLGGIDGLLHWANRLGLEGKKHEEERDKAADAGTACHEMAECHARQIEFDASKYSKEVLEKAMPAFDAFKEWVDQTRLHIVESEISLVSELFSFGGTLDCMLVNNKLSLGDYKTSNSIQITMLCQLAAYKILWEENYPQKPISGGFHLLRFSKPAHKNDPVHFSHHYWSQLDVAEEAFLGMRKLYEHTKRLKGML